MLKKRFIKINIRLGSKFLNKHSEKVVLFDVFELQFINLII